MKVYYNDSSETSFLFNFDEVINYEILLAFELQKTIFEILAPDTHTERQTQTGGETAVLHNSIIPFTPEKTIILECFIIICIMDSNSSVTPIFSFLFI
jgi:hypothetical protein